jgi:hypothetical protein
MTYVQKMDRQFGVGSFNEFSAMLEEELAPINPEHSGFRVEHFNDLQLGRGTAVTIQADTLAVTGVAFCSPKDTFVKRIGRYIAAQRALKALYKRMS